MAVSPLEAALIETWTLYAFGSLVIIARILVRTRMVGLSGFRPDDYLIFFVWFCYTGMTVAAHFVGGTGDTSHLSMEQRLAFTPAQAAARQAGTKWFMVGWYTYVGLIWTLKLNMLFFYRRVVGVVWVKKLIMPTMIFVASTGLAIWILLATACRPFHKLWQILPDPGNHCMPQSPIFLLTILVLNLTTDLCIILIPIPIVVPLKISWGRKMGLLFLFCAGIFIMIAAILRVYFVLALQKGETAAIWSCREDIVAITIGQATMLRPIFTHSFWSRSPLSPHASSYPSNKNSAANQSYELSKQNTLVSRLGFSSPKDPYGISVLHTRSNESEENIIGMDDCDVEEGNANGHARSHVHGHGRVVSESSAESEMAVKKQKQKHKHKQNQKSGQGVIVKKTEVDVLSTSDGKELGRTWQIV